jgi:TolB protein
MKYLFIFLIIYTNTAQAILTIDIVGGRVAEQPIAIIPFAEQARFTNTDMAQIISNNLSRSGRFAPSKQFAEIVHTAEQINLPLWQQAAIPYLVLGTISGGETGTVVKFQLFEVYTNTVRLSYTYPVTAATARRVANRISDDIYHNLTGQAGIFSTRIVYVSVKNNSEESQYQLNIADADGYNPQVMLKSNEPIFSPSWSPDGNQLAYVSMENKQVAVYVQNIRTGARQLISNYPGLNTAPAFSPDGSRIALVLSKDGNPEIYVMDLRNRSLLRLTNDPAIDTEPEWAKDGNSLLFTSDRSGSPQIYHIPANGGRAQRVTYIGRYNARARFSSDGEHVALLHNNGSGFQIAVLHLASGQVTVLTRAGSAQSIDSPSFAPNGNMILYATGSGLAAISVDGRVQQTLTTAGHDVREPAWSPLRN